MDSNSPSPAGDTPPAGTPSQQQPDVQKENIELKQKLEQLSVSVKKLEANRDEVLEEKRKQREKHEVEIKELKAVGDHKTVADKLDAELQLAKSELERYKSLDVTIKERDDWAKGQADRLFKGLSDSDQKRVVILYPGFDKMNAYDQIKNIEAYRTALPSGGVPINGTGNAAQPDQAQYSDALKSGDLGKIIRARNLF